MHAYALARSRGIVCLRSLSILLLALLFVPLAGTMPARQLTAPRVQPALLDLAARSRQVVDVIVQSSASPAAISAAVGDLGGEVTGNLELIGAVVARISATAALTLGRVDGVRWISLDAPMLNSACTQCVDVSRLKSAHIKTIGADRLWNEGPAYLQGQGVGVAVVDSGINDQADLYTVDGRNRLIAAAWFNPGYNNNVFDQYGHGNHVAGIIGSDGERSNGEHIGVAPGVNLINVKVLDEKGQTTMSHVINGLQWIYENRQRYNIRVVNLSMNSSVIDSYHTNALDAALEQLWFAKIVVVVSSGNNVDGKLYPPANDPHVITVGATDDKGTASISDDSLAPFSAYGVTPEGFSKPDLVAPGTNIVNSLGVTGSELARRYPNNVVNGVYFRMSGTSMAAPVVAGTVALMLQREPNLTPDQVKYRLKATARPFDSPARAGAGYLDTYAAVKSTATPPAGATTPPPSRLLSTTGPEGWNPTTWSMSGSKAHWASAYWTSDYWGN
jgi:serine protease AprX